MSHKANDIVADNKLENMPWLFTQTFEVERSDEMEQELAEVELDEWQYDNSYEPTCGGGSEKEY